MNFKNDALRLKEATGKDTEIFIEVFNELCEKFPDKNDIIIGIVEKELEERSKRSDAFIEKANMILHQRELAQAI